MQLSERLPKRLIVFGTAESDRSVIGASELSPQLRRACEIARQLGRPLRRDFKRHLVVDTRAAPPGGQLAEIPPGSPVQGEPKGFVGVGSHGVEVALQPGRLGSGGADGR